MPLSVDGPFTLYPGQPVNVSCEFIGNPKPMVTWYVNNAPVGPAVESRNTLTDFKIEKSTYLTCAGRNKLGTNYTGTWLYLKESE